MIRDMFPRRLGSWFLVVGLVSVATATGHAADPTAPRGIAALARAALDPAQKPREEAWAAGLLSPDARVRQVAARFVGSADARGLAARLASALAAESDRDAAEEQAWALGVLVPGRESMRSAVAAARRFPGEEGRIVGAAAAGLAADLEWTDLLQAGLDDRGWQQAFHSLAAVGGDGLPALGPAVLRDCSVPAWMSYLEASPRVTAAALTAGIQDARAEARLQTLLHLASLPQHRREDLEAVALGQEREQAGEAEAVLRELVARRQQRRVGSGLASRLRGLTPQALGYPRNPWALALVLDESERDALAEALGEKKLFAGVGRLGKAGAEPKTPKAPMWTPDGLPRGLLAAVLEDAGCAGFEDQRAAGANIAFSQNGRPLQVVTMPSTDAGPCQAAAESLFRALRGGRRPGSFELVLLPLGKRFLACLASDAQPIVTPQPGAPKSYRSSKLREPRRIRDDKPAYPDSALREGRGGIVVLQAQVSETGCVRAIEVVASQGPDLDWAALRAVSGWAYEPLLLDGKPAPLRMTVSVNFRR